jgi:hypothetical protein
MITAAFATVVGLVLLTVPAVLVPVMLRVRGLAMFVVAAGVTAAAVVVGVSLALSLVDDLSRTGLLVAQAVVAIACAALWLRAGRPSPPSVPLRALVRRARGDGVTALAVFAAAALAVQFYVAIAVAPNNWDSMTYHLSRAAYWLQYGAVGAFPGGTLRQTASAPNGEILQAWTMAITGTDRFAALVQWACLVGIAACIYAAARLLRFTPAAALFAACLFVILPQPIMQATSTQNDLIVTFFLVASALCTALGFRDRHVGYLVVAGAAAGLAVGTKATALLAAPSLAIIAVTALLAYRPGPRLALAGAAVFAAGLLAFGSFVYIENLDRTGDPLAGLPALTDIPPGAPRSDNAVRVTWSLVDAPGLGLGFADAALQHVRHALGPKFEAPGLNWNIDASVQEDTSAFGLLGWLVLVPLLVFCLLRPRAPVAQRVLAAASLLYLVCFCLRVGANPWIGRLLLPMIALGAPLLALLAARPWLRGVALTLGVLSLVPSVLLNANKTLLTPPGTPDVLAGDRVQQQTAIRPDVAPMLRWMNDHVPATADIGFVGGEDDWDYPLFGAHRTRRVVRLGELGPRPLAALRDRGLVGALFANATPPGSLHGEAIAAGYVWVPVAGG